MSYNKFKLKHLIPLIFAIIVIIYLIEMNKSFNLKLNQSGIIFSFKPKSTTYTLNTLNTTYIPNIVNKSKFKSKNKRNNISQMMKKIVASGQHWRCNICKKILDASYEIDHILPQYKNGGNDISNLQALCRNCHGNKTIYDVHV